MDLAPLFTATLSIAFAALFVLWLLSLALRDASIVDIWWGPGFALIAATAYSVAAGGHPDRRLLSLVLVSAWALRLGAYLLWRNFGEGEDPRYQAMRRYWGAARFPWVSLFTVFALQGVLMWIVSMPVQIVHVSGGDAPLGALDLLGAALVATGLAFEAVGDFQLARFRADPANQSQVMDRGLWRYTRHPNYFGDCVVWWGLFLVALSTPAGLYTVFSPLLMTFLLLRVSGVALLERSIAKRRPEYEAYRARTSAFFPLPPKGSGGEESTDPR